MSTNPLSSLVAQFNIDVTSFWFWYTFMIFLIVGVSSAWILPQILKFQILKRRSYKESEKKEVNDTPKEVRDMSDDETKAYNQALKKNLHNAIGGFILSLVLTYFLLFTYIQYKEFYPLLAEIFIIPELIFFSWWLVKNYNRYIEKKRIVCCVKGPVIIEKDVVRPFIIGESRNVEQIIFLVRAVRFSFIAQLNEKGESESEIMKTLKSLKSGDSAIVEYTLLLNQVLNIQKI